jgi:hypothetical protein
MAEKKHFKHEDKAVEPEKPKPAPVVPPKPEPKPEPKPAPPVTPPDRLTM